MHTYTHTCTHGHAHTHTVHWHAWYMLIDSTDVFVCGVSPNKHVLRMHPTHVSFIHTNASLQVRRYSRFRVPCSHVIATVIMWLSAKCALQLRQGTMERLYHMHPSQHAYIYLLYGMYITHAHAPTHTVDAHLQCTIYTACVMRYF